MVVIGRPCILVALATTSLVAFLSSRVKAVAGCQCSESAVARFVC